MKLCNYILDINEVLTAWLKEKGIIRVSYLSLHPHQTCTVGNPVIGVHVRYKITGNEGVPFELRAKFSKSELDAQTDSGRTGTPWYGEHSIVDTLIDYTRAKLEAALGKFEGE